MENLAKKNTFTQGIGPLDSEDRKMQDGNESDLILQLAFQQKTKKETLLSTLQSMCAACYKMTK